MNVLFIRESWKKGCFTKIFCNCFQHILRNKKSFFNTSILLFYYYEINENHIICLTKKKIILLAFHSLIKWFLKHLRGALHYQAVIWWCIVKETSLSDDGHMRWVIPSDTLHRMSLSLATLTLPIISSLLFWTLLVMEIFRISPTSPFWWVRRLNAPPTPPPCYSKPTLASNYDHKLILETLKHCVTGPGLWVRDTACFEWGGEQSGLLR